MENLTLEQNEAFNSTGNILWINGPAGTGKTVIFCGKLIQLIQSDEDNKVLLFKFAGKGNNSRFYQRALDKASVKYELISTDGNEFDSEHSPTQLANLIKESFLRVIIVEITGFPNPKQLTDRLSLLCGYNLFVDDIQRVLCDYHGIEEDLTGLINKLLDLSVNKNVWIACDVVQTYYYINTKPIVYLADLIIDKLQPKQRITLSMNLRNTCDISNILSVIRDQYVKLYSDKLDILDFVLPTQVPGHFIHGPKTVIHVLDHFNVDIILDVLNMELDKLPPKQGLSYSDIGIVHSDDDYDKLLLPLVNKTVDMRCNNADDKISVCCSAFSYSAEWPVAVLLHQVWEYRSIKELAVFYLEVSRARVHCSVVLYPARGCRLDDYPHVIHLIDKLRDYANIVRH